MRNLHGILLVWERPSLLARRMDYSNRALLFNNVNSIHDEYWIHECLNTHTKVVGGHFVQKRSAQESIEGGSLTKKNTWRMFLHGVFFFFYFLCAQVNRWFFEQFSRQRCMDITFNYSHKPGADNRLLHKLNVKNNKFNKWKATFY